MKSITTKYIGPTNTRGSRIRATDGDNSITVPFEYEHGHNSHAYAAVKLAQKLGWKGRLIEGHTKTGHVYVFDTGAAYDLENVKGDY